MTQINGQITKAGLVGEQKAIKEISRIVGKSLIQNIETEVKSSLSYIEFDAYTLSRTDLEKIEEKTGYHLVAVSARSEYRFHVILSKWLDVEFRRSV